MALPDTAPGIQSGQGEVETVGRLGRVPEIETGLGATDRRDTPPGPKAGRHNIADAAIMRLTGSSASPSQSFARPAELLREQA